MRTHRISINIHITYKYNQHNFTQLLHYHQFRPFTTETSELLFHIVYCSKSRCCHALTACVLSPRFSKLTWSTQPPSSQDCLDMCEGTDCPVASRYRRFVHLGVGICWLPSLRQVTRKVAVRLNMDQLGVCLVEMMLKLSSFQNRAWEPSANQR